jgi:hypothetical protein
MNKRQSNKRKKAHTQNNVVPAAALVAIMALALASVLHELGLLDTLDDRAKSLFSGIAGETGLQPWPPAVVGVVLGLVLFGLVWTMIETPGLWRRIVLWVSCGAVILGAVPVAALTGGWVMPAPVAIAWLWSGAWALAFARLGQPGKHKN